MKIIINRIEDGIATIELENRETLNLPSMLFKDFKEGDTLLLTIEKTDETNAVDTRKIFDELRNKSNTDE